MNIVEYIDRYHNIDVELNALKSNPVKMVEERDDLPYENIVLVDGQWQKIVYINDIDYVTITELLSYYPEDVENMKNKDFINTYKAYMNSVEVKDLDLDSIIGSLKSYREIQEKKKSKLESLS